MDKQPAATVQRKKVLVMGLRKYVGFTGSVVVYLTCCGGLVEVGRRLL